MTNREKVINNISALDDDDFTELFCEMSDCASCPGKPLGNECHQRLTDWLNTDVYDYKKWLLEDNSKFGA